MKQTSENNILAIDKPATHCVRAAKLTLSGIIISVCQIMSSRFCRLLMRLWGGYTVTMPITLNKHSRYIFVANHQSRIDPFATFGVLSMVNNLAAAPVRFMTAAGIYYSFLRLPLKLLGCYPTKGRVDPIDRSVDYLTRGYSIFVFPEGRRTLQSESNPRPGATQVIERFGPQNVTVVLVHIEWTRLKHKRRHASIRIDIAPTELVTQPISRIMNAVYKV